MPFAKEHSAPLPLRADGLLDLRIVLDERSGEVFAADGEGVISDLIFPDSNGDGISLFAGGDIPVCSLTVCPLGNSSRRS